MKMLSQMAPIRFAIICSGLVLVVLMLGAPRMVLHAQDTTPTAEPIDEGIESQDEEPVVADDSWSVPLNLSLSGTASDPQLVVDTNQQFHLFWNDTIDGITYSQGNGETWSAPTPLEVPFGTAAYYPELDEDEPIPIFSPVLAADMAGRIHAFWMDEENILYQSFVDITQLTTYEAWTSREEMAEAALKVAVTVAANGTMHLVYLRPLDTEEAPSGIYYQSSNDGGSSWSAPVLLYQSLYFRSLTSDQVNLRIISNQTETADRLFVAWDNAPLGKAFLIRSADGGQSWEAPVELDSREEADLDEANNPADVVVGAQGDHIVAVWRAGHDQSLCAQYYRWSTDGGATWQPRQQFDNPRGCPEQNQFLITGDNQLILLSAVQEMIHLFAWRDNTWSEPQRQEILRSFINPGTNQLVTLSCRLPYMAGGRLFVIGCNSGTVSDIWVMSRALREVDSWFPSPSAWQTPHLVSTGTGPWASLDLLTDSEGRYHLFWSYEGVGGAYYARWDGANWSQPLMALSSPDGYAEQPAVILSPDGRLLAAWHNRVGELYFSQVEAELAVTSAEWSTPIQLPSPQTGVSPPDIAIDADGTIYVAYALPLNEQRGIYLIRSTDDGLTWSEPALVFDGAGADWPMVGSPRLALTSNGGVHLLWTHERLPLAASRTALALYYIRSEDGGTTFLEPQLVVETPVRWSQIVAVSDQTIHRLWQEESIEGSAFWHAESLDGGVTWQTPIRISNFAGSVALVPDSSERLHLVQNVGTILQQWLWDRSRWVAQEGININADIRVNQVAVAAPANGIIAAAYAGSLQTGSGEEPLLYFSRRNLDLPEAVPTAVPSPTVTPTPLPSATPEPTPSATAIPAFPIEANEADGGFLTALNEWQQLAVSVVPVGLLVVVIVFFGLRTTNRKRH